MRKNLIPFPIVLLLVLLSGCTRSERIPLAFFYLETCPGCDSYKEAEELSGLVERLTRTRSYAGESRNMAVGSAEANEKLMEAIEERDLPDISYALPLLFAGDDYFVGYEDIEKALTGLVDEIR
jgi:hypothetical protein